MARPKRLGFRKKSIPMTALLLAGAFAAGSATFLAVHDSVVPEDATVQEYRLEMPSPAGSSVTVPDGQQPQEEAQEQQPHEQAQEQQPQEQAQEQQPQEQQELVAVDPGTPSTQQEQPEPDALRGASYSGPSDAGESQVASRAAAAASVTGAGSPAPAPTGKPRTYRKSDDPDPYVGVGRNDPCPCGSGKKFKHCHGRNR